VAAYVRKTSATVTRMPTHSVYGTPAIMGSYVPAGMTSGVKAASDSSAAAIHVTRQSVRRRERPEALRGGSSGRVVLRESISSRGSCREQSMEAVTRTVP
jgi:outer membrane biosynthesis protein TonB